MKYSPEVELSATAVNPNPTPRQLPAIISLLAVVAALLHGFSGVTPSAGNWGIHHIGYYPLLWSILLPVLMLLFVIPAVQVSILALLSRCHTYLMSRRRPFKYLLVAAGLMGAVTLFWVGRERLSLLGDGFLVVRRLSLIGDLSDIPIIFKHEPLPGYIMWRLFQVFEMFRWGFEEKFATQLLSIASGACSLFLLARIVNRLSNDAIDRILLFGFIIAAGGTQLFFGYMENYALFYCGMFLFLWLSLEYLAGKFHLALPLAAFGFLFATHFAAVTLLPAVAFLLYEGIRRKEWFSVPLALFIAAGVATVLLWLCGYSLGSFVNVFFKSDKHLIPLTTLTTHWQAYTFFSVEHIIDIANLQLLIAPFGVAVLFILFRSVWKLALGRNPVFFFLALVAGTGLGFILIVNTDLGMSRDWDLLAPFCLGSVVISGFIWARSVTLTPIRQRLMVLMVGITVLHTTVWIALNADSLRSYERFEALPSLRYWGRSAVTSAYEVLAVHSIESGDRLQAVEYYKKFVALDSLNPRIWGNIADIYRHFRREDEELAAYEAAIRLGAREADYFVNLGAIYINRNRIDEAIALTQKALELKPDSPLANSNMGIMLIRRDGAFDQALPYFERAIRFDPTFAGAYYNAARCYSYLRNAEKMKWYFREYLRLDPSGQHAEEVRSFLRSLP